MYKGIVKKDVCEKHQNRQQPAKSWQRRSSVASTFTTEQVNWAILFAKEVEPWRGRLIFCGIKNRNKHSSFRFGAGSGT